MSIKEHLNRTFEIVDDVEFEKQEGFVLIKDQRYGTIIGLDPNASFFWEALAGGKTPDQTVEMILSHCPATRDEVERDLGVLLEKWLDLEMVQPVG